MFKKYLRLWPLFLFSSLIFGGDISPKEVIKNVEKALLSAKTVRVAFEERYIWKLTGEEHSLEGDLLLEGEDKFRVITEDQIIVSDGKLLWTYNKPSHRVLIDKMGNSDNTILPRQILFHYQKDYQARLIGEEDMLGKSCYLLLFTADAGDVLITQIRVWVDKEEWMPRKIEQTDLNENQTIYLLKKIEVGIPFDKGLFKLEIPAGADVVDMR